MTVDGTLCGYRLSTSTALFPSIHTACGIAMETGRRMDSYVMEIAKGEMTESVWQDASGGEIYKTCRSNE